MIRFHTSSISKVFALLLCFLLVSGHTLWADRNDVEQTFSAALKEFNNGMYEQAGTRLERILGVLEKTAPGTRAKVYLLLGACHEESGKKEAAGNCFLELKRILDKGLIDRVPAVEGIETGDYSQYREVFEKKEFFKHNAPTSVSEIMKKNVIHVSTRSIEKKKRKKFPWLLTVASVAAIGAIAVLLFSRRSTGKNIKIPEIQWVQIPAGEFPMGDNFNEGDADELPVHTVYLDEYHISKYEISIEEYFAFCDDTGRGKPFRLRPTSGSSRALFERVDIPMYKISWDDAKAFCDWLSGKTGENIRLPTEAQWEKAARGTYQYRYPWGNSPPDDYKAFYDASAEKGIAVRSRPDGASPYGIHHMAGNAAEWCRDRYSATYYSESPKNNPTGPAGGSFRVIRGGGFLDDAQGIRSANRDFQHPGTKKVAIGFRVVKE